MMLLDDTATFSVMRVVSYWIKYAAHDNIRHIIAFFEEKCMQNELHVEHTTNYYHNETSEAYLTNGMPKEERTGSHLFFF